MNWYTIIDSNKNHLVHSLYGLNGKLWTEHEFVLNPDGSFDVLPAGEYVGSEPPELGRSTSIEEVGGYMIYVSALDQHGLIVLDDHPIPEFDKNSGTLNHVPYEIRGIEWPEGLVGRVIKTDKGKVLVKGIHYNGALPAYFPVGVLV